MTIEVALDGVTVSASNILVGGNKSIVSLPAAADGSGSVGGILFDDPDGDLSIIGWQVVQVTEDDCVSAPTLFWGFVGERTEQRGPYRDGAARQIDTSIIDANTMLMARIVTGTDANRPEETQAARMTWLLGSDAVVAMFSDLGFVNASTTKVLDAANFRGMYPAEVLNSMMSEREETFFLYWDQTAESVGLFFDRPTATTFTCSLTVSNVLSDVDDSTCFAAMVDGSLTWNPEDVYTTGSMKYAGGTEYAVYTPTQAFFDAPSPIITRSFRVENDNVGKATTAHTLLMRMLLADSTERETLRFTVRLPSDKVGLIQAGMRISCRFSHLTGFGSFTYTRIEQIVYVPVDDQPTLYDVTCQCSLHGISTAGSGTGGGSTDPFPYVPPPPDVPTIVQQVSGAGNIAMPAAIGAGNFLIYACAARTSGAPGAIGSWDYVTAGYTESPLGQTLDPGGANDALIIYKLADGTESQYIGGSAISLVPDNSVGGTWYEIAGTFTPDQSAERAADSTSTPSAPAITAAANSFVVGVIGQGEGGAYDSGAGSNTYVVAGPMTEDYDSYTPAGGHPNVVTAHYIGGGSVTYAATGSPHSGVSGTDLSYIAQIVSFTGSGAGGSPTPPNSGNPVGPETVTMSGADGTTAFPFAAGSLHVFVDNTDQTAAITTYDGTAGTFTLAFTPRADELVQVWYIAA